MWQKARIIKSELKEEVGITLWVLGPPSVLGWRPIGTSDEHRGLSYRTNLRSGQDEIIVGPSMVELLPEFAEEVEFVQHREREEDVAES